LDDIAGGLDHGAGNFGPPEARTLVHGRISARLEMLGVLVLVLIAAHFLHLSWRRWPDPLIDFGRELYLPWQLAQGAVLYRDADDFYGPLSQYFNAGLFRLFGPGLMVLVSANLVIFSSIGALLYWLFRAGWGPLAAWTSTALFISVFGFSQFTGFGNYNYATPYSHEATHGLLVCLLLVANLAAWLRCPSPPRSLAAGTLLGLTLVLKPEIMLAAFMVTGVAILLQLSTGRPLRGAAWGLLASGAMLPTAIFVAYFATKVPLAAALEYAGRAWLSVTTSRYTGDPSQLGFLGIDQAWPHLLEHLAATIVALAIISTIAVGAWLSDRLPKSGMRVLALLAVAGVTAWAASSIIAWQLAGRSLLGLVLVYLFSRAVLMRSNLRAVADSRESVLRLLLAVLAATLMARMLLNGRIHQFGFYQAALAALIVVAVMIGELPARLGLRRPGRATLVAGCLCLLLPGVLAMTAWSRKMLEMKTYPVAEGRDRFFAYDPRIERSGEFVRTVTGQLQLVSSGRQQTLLVLPDGQMINYLARMRSPVAPPFFFSSATSGGREAGIVRDLQRHPPDWVVIISRDLREFGLQRYGERDGQGKALLDWTSSNYEIAATLGGDPLDPERRGVFLLAPRP
jgi:hypothetical protein